MCGIAGRINFDSSNLIDETELRRMTNSITHRGPDDDGYFIDSNIGLGFRRLSIIDLHAGHQPLSNHDDDIWITFNGEIYNYQQLRSDLLKEGYRFKTSTDTEVILALYLKYEQNCVDYLRGMFAFVIWDGKRNQLFGARDRFGIKPFYYYINDDSFIWGSEIKVINAVKGINKNISLEALDFYFTYGYIPKEQSIFKQIKKLKPGHSFILKPYQDNKLKITKYWEVRFDPDYSKSESYWIEFIREELQESVKLELVSDVPLGAFLSGGIDSSSVVAMMSKVSERPVKTFSIGFKEEEFNELEYARIVAKTFQTEHHELIVEPESISLLPKLVQAYDEPFADDSAIPTYYVSKFAREFVTVALSGDGGDELFAGYNTYSKMIQMRSSRLQSNSLVKKFANAALHVLPEHVFGKGYLYYLSRNDDNLGAYFCIWKDYERKALFRRDLLEHLKKSPAEERMIELMMRYKGDILSNFQRLDMETYMVDGILTKVDRVSMLNSLEVRVPMLDHKLAELSFRIPPSLKLKDGIKKYILKKSLENLLPPQVLSHKKTGFGVPLKYWFREDLKNYINDSLTSNNLIFNYLNPDYINKTIVNHNKGMRDFSRKIWSVLFFSEWLKANND
jgi:asparagine synthase (glutamine-hydrolysing)